MFRSPRFDWPEKMQKACLPRREHELELPRFRPIEELWDGACRLLRERQDDLRTGLEKTAPELREAAEAALHRGLSETPAPLGDPESEAVLSKLCALQTFERSPWDEIVDRWIVLGGIESALRIAVAGAELETTSGMNRDPYLRDPHLLRSRRLQSQEQIGHGMLPPWLRLREYLAAADESVWTSMLKLAEELRRDAPQEAQIGLAFTFPDHPQWAEQEIRRVHRQDAVVQTILATATRNADLVLEIWGKRRFALHMVRAAHWSDLSPATVPLSMLDANGLKILPLITESLPWSSNECYREEVQACLPYLTARGPGSGERRKDGETRD